MVLYKLTYFDVRGFGECARLLFTYAGVPFEDVRIQRADWPALKPKTPGGQLPILEEDGKVVTQSGAIIRYLARKFGLAGKNEWESLKCDELFCWYYDAILSHVDYILHRVGLEVGDEKVLHQKFVGIARRILEFYTEKLKDSKSGFFLDSGFSYPDVIINLHAHLINNLDTELLADFPVVAEHLKRVDNLPQLKEYVSKRKFTIN